MSGGVVVDASGFGAAFDDILDDFFRECAVDSKKAVSATGRELVNDLKESSPSKTGKYSSGWRMRTEFDSFGGYYVRVYNVTKPSLTHLLEFGHGGPRPAGAHPHIGPAADKAQGSLLQRMAHG